MKKLQAPVASIPTQRPPQGLTTLPELVAERAERFADRTAYVSAHGGTRYSYADVLGKVVSLAALLRDKGIEKGDLVAILGDNCPEWAIAFFASAWAGAAAVPLDARADERTWHSALAHSRPKVLIHAARFEQPARALAARLPHPNHLLTLEAVGSLPPSPSASPPAPLSADDLLEVLFTSGTTGNPKGVMLTHANVLSNVDAIYQILETTPEDRTLSVLPIHHVYESTGNIISSFNNGMTVYFARGLKPRELVEDMREAEPTLWYTAPLILEKMFNRIRREVAEMGGLRGMVVRAMPRRMLGRAIMKRLGLGRIRYIVSGGAPLPRRVSSGLEELGFPVLQGYGLSEASPIVSVNPPSRPKNDSIGMVIPGVEAVIRSPDDEGDGEIAVRGPNVMKGYLGNEEETSRVITDDGWLLTGDVGYFDDEGYLYINGRTKSVIVTPGGKNVYPEELEERLLASPLIEEAVVFSPDDRTLQAAIYPTAAEEGGSFDVEAVWEAVAREIAALNAALPAYKKIARFALTLEELPKTTTRKVKREPFRKLSIGSTTKVLDLDRLG